MQINDDHLKERPKVVGHTGDGRPIVMVETKGGLFAFFAKKDGKVQTLAAAPHRAIGAFLCEQKDREIKWNDKLDELSKTDLFLAVRDRMLSTEIALSKTDTEYYLHYDQNEATIHLAHVDEIRAMVESGEIDPFSIVRKSDLSEPVTLARYL